MVWAVLRRPAARGVARRWQRRSIQSGITVGLFMTTQPDTVLCVHDNSPTLDPGTLLPTFPDFGQPLFTLFTLRISSIAINTLPLAAW